MDLNLLVALDAMLQEGTVTGAARRVGLSQPAMSNALNRLRKLFDDPLFVRGARGMVPTPRALELAGPVRHALATIERTLADQTPFHPVSSEREFTIATNDYVALVLLPQVVTRLAELAPGVDLRVRTLGEDFPIAELEDGRFDLAVGVFPEVPSGFYRQALFHDRFVVMVRDGHPLTRGEFTLERYLEQRHILISPRGRGPGVVDVVLERLGKQRRVAVRVPHFLVAPLVVSRSDLVLTVGSRVASETAPALGLRVLEPPMDLPRFAARQVWHGRFQHDTPHRFLRGLFAEVAGTLDLEEGEPAL